MAGGSVGLEDRIGVSNQVGPKIDLRGQTSHEDFVCQDASYQVNPHHYGEG